MTFKSSSCRATGRPSIPRHPLIFSEGITCRRHRIITMLFQGPTVLFKEGKRAPITGLSKINTHLEGLLVKMVKYTKHGNFFQDLRKSPPFQKNDMDHWLPNFKAMQMLDSLWPMLVFEFTQFPGFTIHKTVASVVYILDDRREVFSVVPFLRFN